MTMSAGPEPVDMADRLLAALLGSYEVAAVALGAWLGWYRALADAGEPDAAELAERSGTDAGYAREWLEHQAVSGYLTVDDVSALPASGGTACPRRTGACSSMSWTPGT